MDNSTKPTLYELMDKVLSDTKLTSDEKIKIIDELRKNNPASSDRWSPRVAIWILGAAVLITIMCITCIKIKHEDVPDGLIAIGSAAVGGLAGLISQTPRTTSDNQQ